MPQLPGLVPYISPSDAVAAAEFYQRVFLATDVQPLMADDGRRYMHCQFTVNGGLVFMSDSFPEYGAPWVQPQGFNLHLNVDNAQEWWDRAIGAGCEVVMPLAKQFWGDIYGQLKDPFGITWAIGQATADSMT